MIYLGSRYQDRKLGSTPESATRDARQLVLRIQPTVDDPTLVNYVWRDGDRIDRLAREKLGNAALWYLIMDYNPGLVDPGGINVGTVLRIPRVV